MTSSNLKQNFRDLLGGHFNQEISMTFRQVACAAGYVQSFMLAQNCRIRISEFWSKLTFLLEQQIKFVLTLIFRVYCILQRNIGSTYLSKVLLLEELGQRDTRKKDKGAETKLPIKLCQVTALFIILVKVISNEY